MRKYIILFLIVSLGTLLKAQDLTISQYPFYRDGINPSSFMQANDLNIFVLHNTQYSGFDDQPLTQIMDASFHLEGNKLGLSLVNDALGIEKKLNIKLRYAKQFNFTGNSFFSLGLSAGAMNSRYDSKTMVFENDDDPLKYTDHSHTQFDFDVGAEWQTDKLNVGVSINHLNSILIDDDNSVLSPHYYGYAQYALNNTGTFRLYPNVIARAWMNTFWGEAGALLFYKDKVWIGPFYSSNHDFSVSTGLRFKNVMLGYAFRANLNSDILASWGSNTHEVFLTFSFNKKDVNIKTPRFID